MPRVGRAGEGDDGVDDLCAGRAERLRPEAAVGTEVVGIGPGNGMPGQLPVGSGLAREEREAKGLIVALDAEHPPPSTVAVAAILRRAEAALERVLDHDVEERHASARRVGREGAGVEHAEDPVLLLGRETGEGCAGRGSGHPVDRRESRAVEITQSDERPAALRRERRGQLWDARRTEELRAPAQLLEAGERDEAAEPVGRAAARRRPRALVGERRPAAEGAAREDARWAVVEGGEQLLDVLGRAERSRARIGVGRDDAIDHGLEGRTLVRGEEPAVRAGPYAARTRPRHGERGDQHAEGTEELPPAEERHQQGSRIPAQLSAERPGSSGDAPGKPEAQHRAGYSETRGG